MFTALVFSAVFSLPPHERVKTPSSHLHARSPAHGFIAEFKVDAIHSLVKPDLLLVILKQVDLVTTGAKLAKPNTYQPHGAVTVPCFFQ